MTTVNSTQVEAYGHSETGTVREDNQDSFRIHKPDDHQVEASHGPLYAVADGMGGYSHGGVASTTALELFYASFYGSNSGQPGQKLKQAVQQANIGVYQTAQRMGAVRMGTTLSAANIVGSELHIVHIGDSRIYLVRDGKAMSLTNDHTMVGELVRARILSPDKVRTHYQRSVLNKCLGIDLFVQPDVSRVSLQEGDVIVLCSDGLWSVLEDDAIAEVASQEPDPQTASQRLIERALDAQSDDNVSAVTIMVQQLADAPARTTQRRSFSLQGLFRSRTSNNA
jgi:PPM family protein phosphatase